MTPPSLLPRLCAALLLTALCTSALADSTIPLWRPAAPAPQALADRYRARRAAHLEPLAPWTKALVGDRLEMGIFENRQLTGRVRNRHIGPNGVLSLSGPLEACPGGRFVLTGRGDSLLLHAEAGRLRYRVLREATSGTLLALEHHAADLDRLSCAPPPLFAAPKSDPAPPPATAGNTTTPIDLLIVYTPAARDWATFNGGIENIVATAAAVSSEVFDNTQIGIELRLVHSAEIEYTESGDSYTDLLRLTDTDDGFLDEAHTLRERYGADLVQLFARTDDYGGISWRLENFQGDSRQGFSVCRVQQAAGGYTPVHELGHNFGLGHHRDQLISPGPGIFDHSAGWRWRSTQGERYCSVMSYESGEFFSDGENHSRAPYFSNPTQTYYGGVVGHPQLADNARTLLQLKDAVASYRDPHLVPRVLSFRLDAGAATSSDRVVTLDHEADGEPLEYLASESPDFADAAWLPYRPDPGFRLSAGNGPKTVYFKLRNADTDSETADDSILLETPPLPSAARAWQRFE